MQRCLAIALLGAGTVSPNPMVGAVIVLHERIIGEGYTSPYGGPHAEVNAIAAVIASYGQAEAEKLLAQATLYVSLEPCAHFGKTPPCADLLIKYRLKTVVIACLDPFAAVNGKGLQQLIAAGIETRVGVLEKEALWLNRRFFTKVKAHRPYIILKWAETVDGYFAPEDGQQRWITNDASKQLVHKWRSEEDAILVGTNTALADNPSLTNRLWTGKSPKRVLVDQHLRVPQTAALYSDDVETLIFNAVKSDWQPKRKFITLENFNLYLPQNIVYQLYLMDVQSLIVEGGAKLLQSFIDAGLWDEARVFQSAERWGNGLAAPKLTAALALEKQQVSTDSLTIYKNASLQAI